MRASVLIVTVLVSGVLPWPVDGQVVPPPTGEGPIVGLYTTATIGDETYAAIMTDGTPFDVHAILSYPGVDAIGAVEFRVEASVDDGLFLVNAWSANPAWEWGWSWPDVLLSWPTPQPVVDDQVWLFGATYLKTADVMVSLHLVPAEPATVEDEMAFLAWDDLDP
ncbi:hypothetical protein GF314_02265, partial [bacterium]|nr:hypothetical protein [bacterium]